MKGEKYMEHAHDSIDLNWEQQEPVFRQINEVGVQSYFENLPELKKAFAPIDRGLRCIDEGTPGGVHMAGSGILDQKAASNFVRHAQVDGIYSHEGCGAAALYAKNMGLDASQSDNYGVEWAKKLAEQAGVPYKGHIDFDQMNRPKETHDARVVYYDGTGKFDPTLVNGLPKGFVISRRYLDPKYSQQELEIAISIALGHEGFGDKFSRENPFWILTVGNNQDKHLSGEILSKEVAEVLKNKKGRVTSFGFSAPV